jgi:hypothetical protein
VLPVRIVPRHIGERFRVDDIGSPRDSVSIAEAGMTAFALRCALLSPNRRFCVCQKKFEPGGLWNLAARVGVMGVSNMCLRYTPRSSNPLGIAADLSVTDAVTHRNGNKRAPRAPPAGCGRLARTSSLKRGDMARLLSVNVGLPRDIEWKGRIVRTGIWKNPVRGRCRVSRSNLDGDGQGDLAGHGGEQRAVFVYQTLRGRISLHRRRVRPD